MNNLKFNILLHKFNNKNVSTKEIATLLFRGQEDIEVSIEELKGQGYLNNYGDITKLGEKKLKENKIDNAIILAAGKCSRFVPFNYECPKGLLDVCGEVLIERQIKQLKSVGINEIIVVVGYMKEKFDYLVEKFGVVLVESKDFETKNNFSSVYAARKWLKNSIITSSDLYFKENIFQKYAFDSYYTCVYKTGSTSERGVRLDSDDKIVETFYGDRCHDVWVTLGHAFFSKRFSQKYIEIVKEIYDKPEYANKFWADIQDLNLDELYMYSKKCGMNSIFEFDSFEELKEFDKSYCYDSKSLILKNIAKALSVKESEIVNIRTLKEIKNSLFMFEIGDHEYVVDMEYSGKSKIYLFDKTFEVVSVNEKMALYEEKILHLEDFICVDQQQELSDLYNLTKEFKDYHKNTVPLCAAENVVSNFSNLPLTIGFQERYIMNNTYSFNLEDNFIGCEKLYPFYKKLSQVCERVFGAKYSDARPFTGMNCIDMVLKSVAKQNDNLMILSSQHGGHASVKPVAEKLGINVFEAPYDLENFDLDYECLNKQIVEQKIKFVLIAPSDIIMPMNLEKINTNNCILLYDCSQVMGLIAAGIWNNPLKRMKNLIMFGGTHKTFPGPASGLILTNDYYLHNMMEKTINPLLLRHSQMHQKISLLFALIEFERFGKEYMSHMVETSRCLACKLYDEGFDVVKINNNFSFTHQVFIRCSRENMEKIYNNAYKYGVTLNKKNKALFNGCGIRLGTQEIARYNWKEKDLDIISKIFVLLNKEGDFSKEVNILKKQLSKKEINFAFSDKEIKMFKGFLN